MSAPPSRWILRPQPRPQARLRLFCFAFGGGGAGAFRAWQSRLPPEVEVLPVQLPGREGRAEEPVMEDWRAVVEAVADEVAPWLGAPFALFGHSLGAMLAFELARLLRRRGQPLPAHLFTSACLPLHTIPAPLFRLEHLPDEQLLQQMASLYGSPLEVLGGSQAKERALPVLRADIRLVERYRYAPEPPLDVPLSAFAGTEDKAAPFEALGRWREQTTREFRARALPGGHFFLFLSRDLLLRALAEDLGL